MAKMRAVDAAIRVLEKEGVTTAFGVPGAAINPLYSAMRAHGKTRHVLARHVEAASHMAEGYTRAKAGNIGVCIGTSGPAGTDMITGLYSAAADSIPILCITGQAPRAPLQGRLPGDRHRVHRQAGRQVGGDGPRAGAGADGVPAGLPRHALGPPRPGADRPADRRPARRDRVRRGHLRAAGGLQAQGDPQAGREGHRHAERGGASADRRRRRHHQRRRLRQAGRVRRAHRRAGHPDPDGLGHDSRRPRPDGRHVRPADLAPLRQRQHAGLGLRVRHRQSLGEPPHRLGRRLHQGPQVHPCRHRADPDRPRLRPGSRHRLRRRRRARPLHRGGQGIQGGRQAEGPLGLGHGMPRPQEDHAAQDALRQRAAQAAARL